MNIRYYLPQNPRFLHHFRQGRYYRFPTCCILWFCAFQWVPDVLFNRGLWVWLGCPQHDHRGHVPCPYHYKRITMMCISCNQTILHFNFDNQKGE